MQETCERILEYETSRHGMKGRFKPSFSFTSLLRRLIHTFKLINEIAVSFFTTVNRALFVVCRVSDRECLVRAFSIYGRKVSCV